MKPIFLLAAAIAAPALAQPALSPTPSTPAAAPAPIDPARLALSIETVDYVWPLGTYERIMTGTFDKMMDGLMASMFDMRAADLVKSVPDGGKAQREVGDDTMREVLLKADPHFEERFRIMNRVMMGEMVPLMSRLEPEVRTGLARAYARRFTAPQLADMNRFFATPSGRAYAADAMTLAMDPEVIGLMSKFAPQMLEAMPKIMKKVEAATAHLPPPPKPAGEEAGEEPGTR